MKHEEKIQLLLSLVNWKEGEDAKFWTRYNLFLSLNSALLAASFIGDGSLLNLSLNNKNIPIGGVLVGFFGLSLSLIWFNLLNASKTYISRWIADIDHLLESEPDIAEYVKGYSDKSSRIGAPDKRKATEYARLVVKLYSVIWGVVILFNALEFLGWVCGNS